MWVFVLVSTDCMCAHVCAMWAHILATNCTYSTWSTESSSHPLTAFYKDMNPYSLNRSLKFHHSVFCAVLGIKSRVPWLTDKYYCIKIPSEPKSIQWQHKYFGEDKHSNHSKCILWCFVNWAIWRSLKWKHITLYRPYYWPKFIS